MLFYENYLRLKKLQINLKQKLSSNYEKSQSRMNDDIYIRDIFVYPLSHKKSYGESDGTKNKYQHYPQIINFIDHIEILAHIANVYHQEYNCNINEKGDYSTKSECLNKITRISLPEFSLYAANPISLDDFGLIIEAVNAIAKNQLPDVHLLLGSFAVILENKQVLNMCLYVQCGSEPKINTFCKARASNDVMYNDTSNFSQQKDVCSTPQNISEYIAQKNGVVISNNSVFTVETKEGAQYTQAVEICFDHGCKHVKELIEKSSKRESKSPNQKKTPAQVDHVLISNSMHVLGGSKISESIIHLDPLKDVANPMKNDAVDKSKLLPLFKKNKYRKMLIEESENGLIVKNPPFGYDYTIVAQEERKLGGYIDNINQMITNRDKIEKQNTLRYRLGCTQKGSEYKHEKYKLKQIIKYIDHIILALNENNQKNVINLSTEFGEFLQNSFPGKTQKELCHYLSDFHRYEENNLPSLDLFYLISMASFRIKNNISKNVNHQKIGSKIDSLLNGLEIFENIMGKDRVEEELHKLNIDEKKLSTAENIIADQLICDVENKAKQLRTSYK